MHDQPISHAGLDLLSLIDMAPDPMIPLIFSIFSVVFDICRTELS